MILPFDQAVDIGHGRGRLAREHADSLARVDAAFGRPADVNEAWRSPEQANANYARYQRYLNGGPWAPIALPADESVHCDGGAIDTDDTSDDQMRIWNDHGWYWTVYRWENGRRVLKERWHLERFRDRDNHRNDPAPTPKPPTEEEQIMGVADDIVTRINADTRTIVQEEIGRALSKRGGYGKYAIINFADDKGRIDIINTENGKRVRVESPYHVTLIRRYFDNTGDDPMLTAETDIVRNLYLEPLE